MDRLDDVELNLVEELRKDSEFRIMFFKAEARRALARQIRSLRAKRGLRQKDFSKISGMAQSAVSRIEQADYSGWTFNTLWKIASALDARVKITIDPFEDIVYEYEDERTSNISGAAEAAVNEANSSRNTAPSGSLSSYRETAAKDRPSLVPGISAVLSRRMQVPALWEVLRRESSQLGPEK